MFVDNVLPLLISFVVLNVNTYGKSKHAHFWSPIFHCVSIPGSDVEFNGLDLEDIQSVLIESNADHLLISGMFGDDHINLEFINGGFNILDKTLLKGKAISTALWDENDWISNKHNEYRYMIKKYEDCASNSYIPNVWFESCGNVDGLHIIRNDSDSICSFRQSMADSISSEITVFIDSAHSFPQIENSAQVTVFDNLDAFQETASDLFPNISFISPNEYSKMVRNYKNTDKIICLIDSRSDVEYDVGRIKDSLNISMERIDEEILNGTDVTNIIATECGENLDELTFVVYCTLGIRAARFGTFLIDNIRINESNVFVIESAIAIWANQGRPMYNDDGRTTLVHTFSNDVGNMYVLPKYRYCC